MTVDFRTESAAKSPKTVQISTLAWRPLRPLQRTFTRAPHPAISRTARRNLQQSRYNSPMRIAHDDDIGARD